MTHLFGAYRPDTLTRQNITDTTNISYSEPAIADMHAAPVEP